nr:MAG TPA: hypothetical protein [Caudoviricetes sp.]
MSNSILETVRRGCQIDQDCDDFDLDLLPLINSVFSKLSQLKVGPEGGYEVTGVKEKWSDYLADKNLLGYIKEYVCKSVRVRFDPPASSTILEAFKDEIKELEWNIIFYLENQNA